MSGKARYVIVAALEREISGLVAGWERADIEGKNLKIWRREEVVASAVGMGWEKAFSGTNVLVEAFRPELVTSVGFSGSLSTELGVGSVFVPAQVVGFSNREVHQTGFGRGTLVSTAGVAGTGTKVRIASELGALAVDMEAAAVAKACEGSKTRFAAVKAISDGVDDEMEFLQAFVTPVGFKTGAFLTHVAMRPKLWGALVRLGRNTSRATESLTAALKDFSQDPEKFLARSTDRMTLDVASSIGR
jgi:nucleoside phosphorylase